MLQLNLDIKEKTITMYESGAQFTKCQEQQKLDKFRKQRNFVTKLKRKSMKTYSLESCSEGNKIGRHLENY